MLRRWHVRETGPDRAVARAIARHARPAVERPSRLLTLLADERFILSLTAVAWALSRLSGGAHRRRADHLAGASVLSALVPHLIKRWVWQRRPDRVEVHGRRRGIPRSGRPRDAFPSGHAVHAGALASALARLHPRWAGTAWSLALALSATRVVLLAHWPSDVAAGLILGSGLEKLLWMASRAIGRQAPSANGGLEPNRGHREA